MANADSPAPCPTRAQAIRAKCLDCCCGQSKEVRLCPSEFCPLHPYRLGGNPYAKPRSQAQLDALAKARDSKAVQP